ncbi:MAG: hypothetical protein MHM6MM_002703 [Cercozoa sp. M6MM]
MRLTWLSCLLTLTLGRVAVTPPAPSFRPVLNGTGANLLLNFSAENEKPPWFQITVPNIFVFPPSVSLRALQRIDVVNGGGVPFQADTNSNLALCFRDEAEFRSWLVSQNTSTGLLLPPPCSAFVSAQLSFGDLAQTSDLRLDTRVILNLTLATLTGIGENTTNLTITTRLSPSILLSSLTCPNNCNNRGLCHANSDDTSQLSTVAAAAQNSMSQCQVQARSNMVPSNCSSTRGFCACHVDYVGNSCETWVGALDRSNAVDSLVRGGASAPRSTLIARVSTRTPSELALVCFSFGGVCVDDTDVVVQLTVSTVLPLLDALTQTLRRFVNQSVALNTLDKSGLNLHPLWTQATIRKWSYWTVRAEARSGVTAIVFVFRAEAFLASDVRSQRLLQNQTDSVPARNATNSEKSTLLQVATETFKIALEDADFLKDAGWISLQGSIVVTNTEVRTGFEQRRLAFPPMPPPSVNPATNPDTASDKTVLYVVLFTVFLLLLCLALLVVARVSKKRREAAFASESTEETSSEMRSETESGNARLNPEKP